MDRRSKTISFPPPVPSLEEQAEVRKNWRLRAVGIGLTFVMLFSLTGCTPAVRADHLYFPPKFKKISQTDARGYIKDKVYRNGYLNVQYVFSDPRWKIDSKNQTAKYHRDYIHFQTIPIAEYQSIQPEQYLLQWMLRSSKSTSVLSAAQTSIRAEGVDINGHRSNGATCLVRPETPDDEDVFLRMGTRLLNLVRQTGETWSVAFYPKKDYALVIESRSLEIEQPYALITPIQRTKKEYVQPLLGSFEEGAKKTKGTYRIDDLTISNAREEDPDADGIGYPCAWFAGDSGARVEILTKRMTATKIREELMRESKYDTDISIQYQNVRLNGHEMPVYRVSYLAKVDTPQGGLLGSLFDLDSAKTEYRYRSIYVHQYRDHLLLVVIPVQPQQADTIYEKYVVQKSEKQMQPPVSK